MRKQFKDAVKELKRLGIAFTSHIIHDMDTYNKGGLSFRFQNVVNKKKQDDLDTGWQLAFVPS